MRRKSESFDGRLERQPAVVAGSISLNPVEWSKTEREEGVFQPR